MPSLSVAVDASAGRCTHLSPLQVCELGQAEAPMSTEPQEAPARPATGRECGCPAWVVRCAHWEGTVLWLLDQGRLKDAGVMRVPTHSPSVFALQGFDVAIGGAVAFCLCNPTHLVLSFPPPSPE